MYRLLALCLVFAAVGCGGGGAAPGIRSDDKTGATATQPASAIAGERTGSPESPTAAATVPGNYTVKDGDTLSAIAEQFGTTVEALVQRNGLANPDDLSVGQVLNISGPASTPTAATATPGASPSATVTPGQ